MTHKTLICPYCHSHDIVIDAYASWNTKAQEWQLASTHDVMSCEKCGQVFHEAFEIAAPKPEPDDSMATPREIKRAVMRYAIGSNDDIEIDKDAKASRTDSGVWVQAWVWLPNKD